MKHSTASRRRWARKWTTWRSWCATTAAIRTCLGLYQGIPLTNRAEYGIGAVLPDRITIFREAILRICRTEADVVRQVRITVVHEVGHHFGLDDDRLHELGWG